MKAKDRVPDLLIITGNEGSHVHYDGPFGLPLCGWDGGLRTTRIDPDPERTERLPVTCHDCYETVRMLWRLWHPRSKCPARFAPR